MPSPTKPEGIMIIGTPRSGTTMLRRLLDAHPNIACPGETNLFRSAARFIESERGAEGLNIGVISGLGYCGFSEEIVLERLREFLFGFHREYASKQGKGRWAEKSAFDAFHLREVEKICQGHVQYICILRHGLDVVVSLDEFCVKTQGYIHELHDYIKQYNRPLEAFAHAWNDATKSILDFAARNPETAITVRYEDLVNQPEAQLQRLLEFLDEPWDENFIEQAFSRNDSLGFSDWKTYTKTKVDNSSVGRWKKISRNMLASLAPIVNTTLQSCGYEEIIVEGEVSDEEARRQYEIGLMLQAAKLGQPKS